MSFVTVIQMSTPFSSKRVSLKKTGLKTRSVFFCLLHFKMSARTFLGQFRIFYSFELKNILSHLWKLFYIYSLPITPRLSICSLNRQIHPRTLTTNYCSLVPMKPIIPGFEIQIFVPCIVTCPSPALCRRCAPAGAPARRRPVAPEDSPTACP